MALTLTPVALYCLRQCLILMKLCLCLEDYFESTLICNCIVDCWTLIYIFCESGFANFWIMNGMVLLKKILTSRIFKLTSKLVAKRALSKRNLNNHSIIFRSLSTLKGELLPYIVRKQSSKPPQPLDGEMPVGSTTKKG